jgi:hypothetical protein
VKVSADSPITDIALAEGYESRYYGKKTTIPVLEVVVDNDATITTIINLK